MRIVIPLLLLVAACLCGCAANPPGPTTQPARPPQPGIQAEDEEGLRSGLGAFLDEFQSTVDNAADAIADKSDAPDARKACVMWKTKIVTKLEDAISTSPPAVALLEAWTISVRMDEFLARGQGKELFGNQQKQAIDASRHLLSMIESLAARHIKPADLDKVRPQIYKYARDYPLSDTFEDSEPAPLRMNNPVLDGLMSIISIPASPFVTGQKIQQGVDEFKGVAPMVGRVADILQDYPRETRWQAERLLLVLDKNPSLQSALTSLNRISDFPQSLQQAADQSCQSAAVQSKDVITHLGAKLDQSLGVAGDQSKSLADHIAFRLAELMVLAAALVAVLIVFKRALRPKQS